MYDDLGSPVEGPEGRVVELFLGPGCRAGRSPQLNGVCGHLELVDPTAQRRCHANAEQDDRNRVIRAECSPSGKDLEGQKRDI